MIKFKEVGGIIVTISSVLISLTLLIAFRTGSFDTVTYLSGSIVSTNLGASDADAGRNTSLENKVEVKPKTVCVSAGNIKSVQSFVGTSEKSSHLNSANLGASQDCKDVVSLESLDVNLIKPGDKTIPEDVTDSLDARKNSAYGNDFLYSVKPQNCVLTGIHEKQAPQITANELINIVQRSSEYTTFLAKFRQMGDHTCNEHIRKTLIFEFMQYQPKSIIDFLTNMATLNLNTCDKNGISSNALAQCVPCLDLENRKCLFFPLISSPEFRFNLIGSVLTQYFGVINLASKDFQITSPDQVPIRYADNQQTAIQFSTLMMNLNSNIVCVEVYQDKILAEFHQKKMNGVEFKLNFERVFKLNQKGNQIPGTTMEKGQTVDLKKFSEYCQLRYDSLAFLSRINTFCIEFADDDLPDCGNPGTKSPLPCMNELRDPRCYHDANWCNQISYKTIYHKAIEYFFKYKEKYYSAIYVPIRLAEVMNCSNSIVNLKIQNLLANMKFCSKVEDGEEQFYSIRGNSEFKILNCDSNENIGGSKLYCIHNQFLFSYKRLKMP